MERYCTLLKQPELPAHHHFEQISRLIKKHNAEHPDEMLIKDPGTLCQIHQEGLSHLIVFNNEAVAHAALWPLLIKERLEIYELGTWIVDPRYRHLRINDLTLGEYVASGLLKERAITNSDDPKIISVIATVKKYNSLKGLQKAGFEAIKFLEYPFLMCLTCTCPNTSEHYHQKSCRYRQPINFTQNSINYPESNQSSSFTQKNLGNEPLSISCTLLGYNAYEAEQELRRLYTLYCNNPIPETINPFETPLLFPQLKEFYERLGVSF